MREFNKIQLILDRTGRRQNWLAKQLDISTNTLSNFCRNESQPKLDMLYEIAKILNVSVLELLVEDSKWLEANKILPQITEFMSKNRYFIIEKEES